MRESRDQSRRRRGKCWDGRIAMETWPLSFLEIGWHGGKDWRVNFDEYLEREFGIVLCGK
jgi:hypothetical protein